MKLAFTGNKKSLGRQIGLFFEDINYALDGGLHAEMLENRNFEAFDCGGVKHEWTHVHDGLYAWGAEDMDGKCADARLSIGTAEPLSRVNIHYLAAAVPECGMKIYNSAYEGLTLTAGKEYLVSLYARTIDYKGSINVLAGKNKVMLTTAPESCWTCYSGSFTACADEDHEKFAIELCGTGEIHFDFVSVKPADAVYGVFRRDLADALKDLKPSFLRFPGGCVVEGNTYDNMYRWKETVGDPVNRRTNWNRWAVHENSRENGAHGKYAHYNQSLGVGYYEYFELCEYIGARPLPVCNVGMVCQFESVLWYEIGTPEFNAFLQDALDLIEFANGDVNTTWGKVRAEMGHPAPFGLTLLGIGNEQWQLPESDFFSRYRVFEKAIHEKYPEIELIGSAGPDVTSEHYTDAWDFYRTEAKTKPNFAAAIDEHYYVAPEWLFEHGNFYDDYPRNIKVFAGEYASHVKVEEGRNKDIERCCFLAALSEASFMTGLERNCDLVTMASYAPLFARQNYVQWGPDLIWFNDRQVIKTPSYYVQQLFSLYAGDEELEVSAPDGVSVCASRDSSTGKTFIKLINTLDAPVSLETGFNGKGEQITMKADLMASNTFTEPQKVVPVKCETADASKIELQPQSINILIV